MKKTTHTILIVDDEINLLEVLSVAIEDMGHTPLSAETAEDALAILEGQEVHMVLSDLRLPGLSGRELLNRIKKLRPELPVVIMTAYASLKDAVELIKEGAFDYTVKPFDLDALEATLTSALRVYSLGADNRQLRDELKKNFSPDHFVGQSPAFQKLSQSIREVGATSANVLLTGESGTGKEVAAKAIHYSGPRSSAPFVTINCAAIPENLLESELFGHVKGAFTGANTSRPGRFAQADSGTVFLDEIGDMPLALQAKILRCIQEKTIEPVGSGSAQKVDVRIIAATNQDLTAAVSNGSFRQDLYYRLNVYPIVIPPLRERKEDIPLLAASFARRAAANMGKRPVNFTPEAMQTLQDYAWPGNVRELQNCMERLTIVAGSAMGGTAPDSPVTRDILKACFLTEQGLAQEEARQAGDLTEPALPTKVPGFPMELDAWLREMERSLVLKALEESGGVQVKAAELLGISERSIWHRIKKLDICIHNKKELS